MTYVAFTHPDYGEMETTAHAWIAYALFDAVVVRTGETHPVYQEECRFIRTYDL